MRVNGNVTLPSNGQGEVQNALIERVTSLPSVNANEKGRIVFNTSDNIYYYNNGTVWMAFATGGNASALQTEVDNLEVALGSSISAAGQFVSGQFTGYAAGATNITEAINLVQAALTAHNSLGELDNVADTADSSAVGNFLVSDSAGVWTNRTPVLADISNVTASASEVNQLTASGVVTADLAKLHAVTADAAELNILDGALLTTTELNYVDGVTSSIQTQLNDKQPLDFQLTSIASLEPSATSAFLLGGAGVAFNEYSLQTAAGFRTALGVSYTDVQPYDLDLVTLAGFTPAADSSESFTINGASVSHTGLNDIIVGTGGVEGARWTLERGATARTSLGLGDIATMDQAWFVRGDANAASSNIAKDLSINNYKITNLAPGVSGTDAINKNQLEAAITGLFWKQSVRAATTADIALTGEQTIDGVILAAGQRVLVKNQTASAENGIYLVASGAWTRTTDMDAAAEFDGSAVLVEEGTQAYTAWTETATVAAVGTSPVTFTQFNGAAGVTAGIGLSKNGNQIDINLGAGIVELPSDEVGIDLYDATSSALILTSNATSRSTATNAKLHLLLDTLGNGQLEQSAAGLKVTTNTITENELTASVAGNGLVGGNGTPLAVVSAGGTGSTGGDTPASWAGVGQITVTADAVGVTLGSGSTQAAPGNHTHKAAAITFSNTASALLATDVQGAIDEVEGRLDTAVAAAGNLLAEVNAIEDAVGLTSTGTLAAFSGTNYLDATSTIKAAEIALDTAVKALDTQINNKVNKMYYLYDGGASTGHTVTHNLGQKYVNVTVVDAGNDEVIIPQSIVFSSATALVVTLNVSLAVKVIVMGLA